MKAKNLLNLGRFDPSKQDGSYQESLIGVTRAATKYTTVFFIGFALVYWFGEYPRLATWVNIVAVLCSLTGYVLTKNYARHRLAAHLIIFAIYLSSAGVMAISGGIHSSSVVWQIFVPVAAFIMVGLYAGLRWGVVSLVTVIAFYFLETTRIIHPHQYHSTTEDLLIDLIGAIIASSIAIWYSDKLKSNAFTELERTKAELNFYATIDPLTNTYNRRHFLEQSEKRIQRIYTSQGYASFLLFDIDHFKEINDTHGHLIGDQILRGLAQVCMQHLRPDDILGRFGGEEFVVLLPDTNVSNAQNIAERLRLLVETTPIATDNGLIKITISIGVAVMEKPKSVSLDQLLFRADRAMYRAKQAGRNQVSLWNEAN